jgi:uncharacterized membrane protein
MKLTNANLIYKKILSDSDKLAIGITDKVGTIGFFMLIFFWTVGWLSWNIFAPINLQFDPYPAFVLWLFISNMIQIFLMPLIMIGQNLQGKRAEIHAENDYQVNLKAEQEILELKEELLVIKNLLYKITSKD